MSRTYLEIATSHSALRYAIVGVGNTIAGLMAILSIKYFMGATDAVANLGGYIIGFYLQLRLQLELDVSLPRPHGGRRHQVRHRHGARLPL